jgi:hypothetical protein
LAKHDDPASWPLSEEERQVLVLFRLATDKAATDKQRRDARSLLDRHARRVMHNSALAASAKPTNMFLGTPKLPPRPKESITLRERRSNDMRKRSAEEGNRRARCIDSLRRTNFPSVKDYKKCAAADDSLSSYRTIYREFGSWPEALKAARP